MAETAENAVKDRFLILNLIFLIVFRCFPLLCSFWFSFIINTEELILKVFNSEEVIPVVTGKGCAQKLDFCLFTRICRRTPAQEVFTSGDIGGFFGKKSCGMCQDGLDARENELLTEKANLFEIGSPKKIIDQEVR